MLTATPLRPTAAPRTACFTRATAQRALVARRVAPVVRCSAEKADDREGMLQKAALPAAALLGAALLFAATPDEALAARSGGRVGGSSFSSRPRSAPMPRSSGPSVRNYNYYSAPPLVSPFGFGFPGYGFGYGGVGVFPMFGIGSIFNIILLMFIVNVVLSTIRNFTEGGKKDGRVDDDSDDERW